VCRDYDDDDDDDDDDEDEVLEVSVGSVDVDNDPTITPPSKKSCYGQVDGIHVDSSDTTGARILDSSIQYSNLILRLRRRRVLHSTVLQRHRGYGLVQYLKDRLALLHTAALSFSTSFIHHSRLSMFKSFCCRFRCS
jgi:hypothetical protein